MKTKVENKKQDTYTANLKIYQVLVYLRKSKKTKNKQSKPKTESTQILKCCPKKSPTTALEKIKTKSMKCEMESEDTVLGEKKPGLEAAKRKRKPRSGRDKKQQLTNQCGVSDHDNTREM